MYTNGYQNQQVAQKTPIFQNGFICSKKKDYYLSTCMLLLVIIFIFASALFLNSCTSTASKIQGKWEITEIYDGKIMEDKIEVEFVGDSLQIITYPYYKETDTIRIRIIDDKWLWLRPWKNVYDTIATIELLSKTKIVLNIIDEFDDGHVLKHEFNRITPKQDFSNEKEISPKKYEKKIVGEWVFVERKNWRGEWKDYGEPVGWHMIFSKDGNGYQIRDDEVATFQWLMMANGGKVILTGSKYPDSFVVIKSMTNNTMHFILDDEEFKLIRQQ